MFLAELRKIPIVLVAAEKANLSRNTIYRWRNDDETFRKEMDEAMVEGDQLVNDMTEANLLTLIQEKNWQAISFWLRLRNPKFRDKLELSGKIDHGSDTLSAEQEALVRKALELGGFTDANTHEHDK